MNKSIIMFVALIAVLLVGVITIAPAPESAYAQVVRPSMSHEVTGCGTAVLTFNNPTRFSFAFDYRLGDEDPTYETHPALPGTITQGPYSGQPFGPYYRIVSVPRESTVTIDLAFAEDENGGSITVMYKLQLGAEQNWYLLPIQFEVSTDCLPPDPTPEETPVVEPTEEATPEVTPEATQEPTVEPTDEPAAPTVTVAPAPGGGFICHGLTTTDLGSDLIYGNWEDGSTFSGFIIRDWRGNAWELAFFADPQARRTGVLTVTGNYGNGNTVTMLLREQREGDCILMES